MRSRGAFLVVLVKCSGEGVLCASINTPLRLGVVLPSDDRLTRNTFAHHQDRFSTVVVELSRCTCWCLTPSTEQSVIVMLDTTSKVASALESQVQATSVMSHCLSLRNSPPVFGLWCVCSSSGENTMSHATILALRTSPLQVNGQEFRLLQPLKEQEYPFFSPDGVQQEKQVCVVTVCQFHRCVPRATVPPTATAVEHPPPCWCPRARAPTSCLFFIPMLPPPSVSPNLPCARLQFFHAQPLEGWRLFRPLQK